MTIDELRSAAAVVRDATEEGENTATRIGQLFLDTVNTLCNVSTNAIKGYVVISSTSDLPTSPTTEQQMKGYLLGTTLYVWVGTGGDTLDGKYQSAQLKGEDGKTGPKGDSGVHLGDVVLVNDLTTGGEVNALSAEMGKVLNEKLATKADKTELDTINANVDQKVDKTDITQSTGTSTTAVMSQKAVSDNISKITDVLFPKEASNTLSVDPPYFIGQEYIVNKTNLHVNAGVEYNITIHGTVVSNTTTLRLMDENNSQIIVAEIDGSRGNENRTITFTPPQSGYIALVVLELKEYGSYTIKTTLVKDDSITSTVERLTKKVDEVSSDHTKLSEIDNTLYGSIYTFTEEYDFTKFHVQSTYVVKKGNLEISKGHKYEITISPSEDGMESFLRIFDTSNTSILQSGIPNSSGESNRTITFKCEFDGKIAVVIRTLTKLCTVSLTVKDVTNVGGIVKKLEQLEDSNSIIKQLKVLVIGDSITTGSSSAKLSSVNMPSYGKYEKWVDILIELGLFNSDTINCSQHATGFVAKNGSSDWVNNSDFLSRLKYFVNNNTINPSTIDLIIVFGGINDFKLPCEIGEFGEKDTTKFIPALEAFYNYLEETFTQARIVVCTPTRCAVTTGKTDWSTRVDWAPDEGFVADENSLRITYDTYVEAIKNCCKKYSLPVIDLAYESGFMPLNKKNREKWSFVWNESASIPTDGIHPNYDFQQKMLAPMIYGFVSKLFMSQNNSYS